MSDEKAEENFLFKPGYRYESIGIKGVVTIQIFEQLQNSKFIYAKAERKRCTEPSETYDEDVQTTVAMPDGNYATIEKAPWCLVEKPLPFNNELWNEIKAFIYEHLFLPDENLYDVLTAWVFASWIPEVWTVIPYIFFYGPVASGKTRGLEVLHRLSYRAIMSSNISSAALFRACEAWKPSLILDETEIYNKQEKNEIIGLLNSGYRRGQFAIRVKTTERGEILECFDVFGFKALAGTEGLAKTLESRSIMIRMLKNRRKVKLHVNEEKANDLRAKLLSWRLRTLTSGELCEVCEGFMKRIGQLGFDSGRLEELFQCLLAVANDGRESILHYAEKMNEMRLFEEATSIEAEVIEIMLNSNLGLFNNVILTKDVTEKFNSDRVEREKVKSSYVGWTIRRLGFEARHTRHGNGWLFDRERLNYLKQIYLSEPSLAKKGSQGSQGSRSMDVDGMESVKDVKDVNLLAQPEPEGSREPYFTSCYFCQKPIYTEDYVTDEFTANKPAHKECYEKQKGMSRFGEALSTG
jgi:hypothetical protein